MNKFTHFGVVNNHNYGEPIRSIVQLRETKNFWISLHGIKYRKRSGLPAGCDIWNQHKLDLSTVKIRNE